MTVRVADLTYTYPGGANPALAGVSFTLGRGECVCLTGPSGCGKSTLLLAMKGLLREGAVTGTIEIPSRSGVGIVFQNPESQILCTTVAEEVAFGPENLCVEPEEIGRRVGRSLSAVRLGGCESRSVERFSAGQKQRLAIASVLSMEPQWLLLDEPTSQLDRKGKLELAELLLSLKRQGYGLLIAEHDLAPVAGIADRYLLMEGGRIVAESSQPLFSRLPFPVRDAGARGKRCGASSTPAVSVVQLCLTYPETGLVLDGVAMEIGEGELVHIAGHNGAGKSSLLRCLAGLETPDSGRVEIAGVAGPCPATVRGKVGYLFQNPSRQLFADTVFDEVAFSLKRCGRTPEEVNRDVAEALELCEIPHLAGRAPLALSFGEQHRVALATVLALRPSVLLLDEPFSGLDMEQRLRLLRILSGLPERYGASVVIASHDDLPDMAWADRVLVLKEGRIG
ncbi:MAG: ABC transporter ATP-binding protein [Geobacter sp.]|nr:ABC transporter ATP-binding protein [Geobacter sp.]